MQHNITEEIYSITEYMVIDRARTVADYMVFILTYLVYFAFYALLGQDVKFTRSIPSSVFCY